jgi:hypothetical protein
MNTEISEFPVDNGAEWCTMKEEREGASVFGQDRLVNTIEE